MIRLWSDKKWVTRFRPWVTLGRPSEQAGEHVDHAVVDDQQVDGGPLLVEDRDGGQQVDQHGDHRDRDVGEQVALSLGHIHLLSRMQLLIGFAAF